MPSTLRQLRRLHEDRNDSAADRRAFAAESQAFVEALIDPGHPDHFRVLADLVNLSHLREVLHEYR